MTTRTAGASDGHGPVTDEQIADAVRILGAAVAASRTVETQPDGAPEPPSADGEAQRLLYTVPDAAWQLSVSERTMRALVADGEVDAVRIGRRLLVPHEALVEYVERLRAAR